MPVADPEKNKEYVARHRAKMKAKEETTKEYNLMRVIIKNMKKLRKKN